VIGFDYGIPYGDLFGHRGITHSLAFAALMASGLTATLFRAPAWRGRRLAVGVFLFLCGASHGFFDAMTNGGLGVAFFAPFDNRRSFLTFRPLEVAFGRGVRFANRRPRDSSQTGHLGPFSRGSLVTRRLRRR